MPYKKLVGFCIWCRKKKLLPQYGLNKSGKFCSTKCYVDFRASNTEIRKCKKCGKDFKVNLSQIKAGWGKGIYCSHECYWTYPKSQEFKQKISRAFRGKNHPNWKGGVIKGRKERNLIEYKNWRKAVFYRDNYICRDCKKRGDNLEADHIKPWAIFPELRYKVSNGRTLCEKCHWKRKKETMEKIKKTKLLKLETLKNNKK